jgi:hypothetical protein
MKLLLVLLLAALLGMASRHPKATADGIHSTTPSSTHLVPANGPSSSKNSTKPPAQ